MSSDKSIISVKELKKTYSNGVEAVKGISLDINKGEIFSLLGPNGAGKSTSINMIVGLLEPSEGEISIYGEKIKARSTIIKEKVGIIPQEITLWEMLTVYENLKFLADIYNMPKEIAEERINNLIKRIHLEEKRNELVKNLSGGLKRRLQVIMGLVHDPEIILCDEPTPGLDPQSRLLVWEFLQNLSTEENRTIVLTTHFMDEADRLSDRLAIIDNGKLLVIDDPENLKDSLGEGDTLELTISDLSRIEEVITEIEKVESINQVLLVGSLILVRSLGLIQITPNISAIIPPVIIITGNNSGIRDDIIKADIFPLIP